MDDFYKKVINDSNINSNLDKTQEGKSIVNMKHILNINYQVLKQYLNEMQDPQYILKISNDPFLLEEEKRILTCYFYNFLITAKSLIEHIEKYIHKSLHKINESLYEERLILIQNKIKEFNNSKEGHFIRQFRNYIIWL